MKATLIETVKEGDEAKLAERELYWQYQLRTFEENGGNGINQKDDLNWNRRMPNIYKKNKFT